MGFTMYRLVMTELYEPHDGTFDDDLSIELWQDDGETTYWCTPESCGYEGETHCSNCGFDKDGE